MAALRRLATLSRHVPVVNGSMSRRMCAASGAGSGGGDVKPIRLSATMILVAPPEVAEACSYSDEDAVPGGVDGATDPFRVLFVRRSLTASFMPGAYVFPGGVLDDSDGELRDDESRQAALKTCASRELFEETGLLSMPGMRPAQNGSIGTDELGAVRKQVIAKPAVFQRLLDGVVPGDVAETKAALHSATWPWSNFITPIFEKKRFDAYFFMQIARTTECLAAPEEAPAGGVQDGETIALRWLSPKEAIGRAASGELFLPPPQYYLLHELAEFDSLDQLESAAAGRKVIPFMPHLVTADAVDDAASAIGQAGKDASEESSGTTLLLALPGDAEHPETEATADPKDRHRVIMKITGKATQYKLEKNVTL